MSTFYKIINATIPYEERNCLLFFTMNNFDNEKAQKKYGILSRYLFPPFEVDNILKETILEIFGKSQKIYHALSRFALICKIKKRNYIVEHDMYYNPIDKTDNTTIIVIQNKQNYLFKVTDIVNIIETAICTATSEFFIEPKFPVNPYNNLPFSFADMYNVYFRLKSLGFVIPKLIHGFFLCNFDIDLFLLENETDIKEKIIYDYIYRNNDVKTLYREYKHMMREFYHEHRIQAENKIIIDDEFPRDRLIEIMKTYLYLYCSIKYSIYGLEKIQYYKMLSKNKMLEFIKYNPLFGRKYIKNRKVYFNEKHKEFTFAHVKGWRKNNETAIMTFQKQSHSEVTHNSNAIVVTETEEVQYNNYENYYNEEDDEMHIEFYETEDDDETSYHYSSAL